MNTFHMSFGKMTITLDDVPTLVGIPVMGRSVNMPQRITDTQGMLVSLLGVSPQEAADKLGMVRGSPVRLESIRSKFSNVIDSASIDILSALPELISCIWSVALSSVTRVE